jgi:dTDP-glucose 4,6-dehydratase
MRIVITGGAGFLGSNLCDRLLGLGHQVVCLDNLVTGNVDNITHLLGNDRFRFVKHDVTEYLFIDGDVDAVMHFASPASPRDYLDKPIQTLKVGSLGTHKTLGLAKAKTARFLLASTSEIYGDPLINPQPETYWGNVNPIGVRGVYDEAKRFGEALAMAYHRYHGVDSRIVRIFNTYGPRMRPRDGRVVSNFVMQALLGEPLTIYGKGEQTRSFTFVDDEVDGIVRLLMAPESDEMRMPFNIGNPRELTILEIAEMVLKQTGSASKLVFKPLPEDDPKVRRPDITRATTILGWKPRVDLEDGLKRTIEYFRRQIAEHRITSAS